MSLRDARVGILQAHDKVKADQDARERQAQADAFLNSPIWKAATGKLRDSYIELLKDCPVGDDQRRLRLVWLIKDIDILEKHIRKVHSDADVNLKQVNKDLAPHKRGLFA